MKLKLSISILLALLLPVSLNVLALTSQSTGSTPSGRVIPYQDTQPADTQPADTATSQPTNTPLPVDTTTTVTCPASEIYSGAEFRPCSATVSGVSNPSLVWTYGSNTDVGGASVTADFLGDTYHNPSSGTGAFNIVKAPSLVTVGCADVTYNGNAQTTSCSAEATGAGGLTVLNLAIGYTANINAGSVTASASWGGDSNHTGSDGKATFTIYKAAPNCSSITAYDVPYDGASHSASGSCNGVFGEVLSGLDLGRTAHSDAGVYSDAWTFGDTTGNYSSTGGTLTDKIDQIAADCSAISPYEVTYDASSHTATGKCTSFEGTLDGLNLSATTHTDAGDYSSDAWTFTNKNYITASGSIDDIIHQTTATCNVIGYSGVYDGVYHGASGSCTTVGGVALSSSNLSLGNTFNNVPGGSAHWVFSDPVNISNTPAADVNIVLTQAASTVTVTCPASVVYDETAQTPCSAEATGAGVLVNATDLPVTYTANTNVGTVTASASWAGDNNHTGNNGSAQFQITPATADCSSVVNYHHIYSATAWTATGACLGVNSEILAGLNLGGTTHTNANTYSDSWSFHDSTGNYKDAGGSLTDVITKRPADCTAPLPYNVPFNNNPHTASGGSCTGIGSDPVNAITLSGTTHTNAGDYPNDQWVLNDPNYTGGGTIEDVISQISADCSSISGYSGVYDGAAHGASGTCTGAGISPSDINLGVKYTDVPGGSADWTFYNPNYLPQNGTVNIVISVATPTCTATPYNVPFNGAAHTATVTCKGVGGANIPTSYDLSLTQHTNAGDYPADQWIFSNIDYVGQSGFIHDVITKITPTCTITPYTVAYDGNPHSATGFCRGASGVILAGLDTTNTTHTNFGTYATDSWVFTDTTGNYNNVGPTTITDRITKATPTCTATPYNLPYDGLSHQPVVTCKGAKGEDLSSDVTLPPAHTLPGDYSTDKWTFVDPTGNYVNNINGTLVNDHITYLAATCTITPYNVVFTNTAHTATGSCTGGGGPLSGLSLATTTHTNAGSYTDAWTFTDSTGIYQALISVNDIITPAPTVTTITCPVSVIYTGVALLPCTSLTNGVGLINHANTLTQANYTNNTIVSPAPGAIVNFTYPAAGNYLASTAPTANFLITPMPTTITVTCPASVPYTGSAQTPCTATVRGGTPPAAVPGAAALLTLTYTNNIAAGSTASFTAVYAGDPNHLTSSGNGSFVITNPQLVCNVTAYAVTYDGNPHTATGTCITTDGKDFTAGLTLNTTHTNAAAYNSDTWSFHDSTGTWPDQNGTVSDNIAKAPVPSGCNAGILSFYNGPYTGTPHGGPNPTNCKGVKGEDLSSLLTYSGTYINVTTFGIVNWSFNQTSNPNYNPNYLGAGPSYGIVIITKANPKCTITGFTGIYDGLPHAATGSCVGVLNETLVTLNLNTTSHTLAGTYTSPWTFTPAGTIPNSNYNAANGTVSIVINKAPTVTTVTCPASVPYNGAAQTPCTAKVTDTAGDLNLTLTVTYSNNMNVGNATASATYAGDANHATSTFSATFAITKIDPICNIPGYNVPYDGTAHIATGTCNGSATGLNLSSTSHTDAGVYSDPWSFSDSTGNYNDKSGNVTDTITKINATCNVTGYNNVPYDGTAHTATGTCTGLAGVTLNTLDLSGTSHTDAGSFTDTWNFKSANSDYNDDSGTVSDSIDPVDAKCSVTPYNVPYDGKAHTATGTCTGVGGASVSGLDVSGTTHTDAGAYPNDTWSFTDSNGNYNSIPATTVSDNIAMADAKISVTGFTGPYDGDPHGATGTATGVNGEDLGSLLHLGDSFTNIPGGTADWTFDGNTNYNPAHGSVEIVITVATANCSIQPYNVAYDGTAHTATGTCTGVKGVTLDGLDLSTTTHTDAGNYTDAWSFKDGTGDYKNDGGNITDIIAKLDATCTVNGYTVAYDGNAHTATGSCTGLNGAVDGLDLSATTHTDAGDWPGDAWTFTNPNYNTINRTVHDTITKLDATCTITGYTVDYDGNAHSATGSCTAPGGATVSGLDLGGTTHTNAGDYPDDAWTFTSPNYNPLNGKLHDSIARINPTCTVTGYSVTFDGNAHLASGACLGAKGETLSGLNLGATSHTDPGDYPNDGWTFTDTVTGNYNSTSSTVHDNIAKADPLCTVNPYNVPFDGVAHTANGTCTGVGGVAINGLVLTGTTHTNAGDYTADAWTFSNSSGNYNNATGTIHDVIAKYSVTCTITPYSVPYNGSPHSATGYCMGVGGVNITGLDLGGSTHTNAGDYPSDTWTFTDSSGNYANNTGIVHDSITQIAANCTVTPYNLPYDNKAHTATGTCTGIGGASLTGLDLGSSTHTDAGDYPNDAWVFTNTNYNNANGIIHDVVAPARANCNVTGYTGSYDGQPHGASGSCTIAGGVKMSGLTLGNSFTNVPGGTAYWNFTNPNVAPSLNGNVNIVISLDKAKVNVICPAKVTYTGSALAPCTAKATSAGGLNLTVNVSYSNNTDLGTATANASYPGDANHTSDSGSATFIITNEIVATPTSAALASVPQVNPDGSPVAANHKGEIGLGTDLKAVVLAVLANNNPAPTPQPTNTKAVVNSSLGGKTQPQNSKPKTNNFWATYSGLFGCLGTVFLAFLIFFMFRRRTNDETEENNQGTDQGPNP